MSHTQTVAFDGKTELRIHHNSDWSGSIRIEMWMRAGETPFSDVKICETGIPEEIVTMIREAGRETDLLHAFEIGWSAAMGGLNTTPADAYARARAEVLNG